MAEWRTCGSGAKHRGAIEIGFREKRSSFFLLRLSDAGASSPPPCGLRQGCRRPIEVCPRHGSCHESGPLRGRLGDGRSAKESRTCRCLPLFFLCHLRTATAVRARVDVVPRVAWHCACMSHAISHVHVAVENAHARALYVIHCAPPSALQEKERGSSGGPTMLASYHKRSSRRILTTPYIRSFLPHRRCTCCQSSTRQQRRQT